MQAVQIIITDLYTKFPTGRVASLSHWKALASHRQLTHQVEITPSGRFGFARQAPSCFLGKKTNLAFLFSLQLDLDQVLEYNHKEIGSSSKKSNFHLSCPSRDQHLFQIFKHDYLLREHLLTVLDGNSQHHDNMMMFKMMMMIEMMLPQMKFPRRPLAN